jgi:hypothetical protein
VAQRQQEHTLANKFVELIKKKADPDLLRAT